MTKCETCGHEQVCPRCTGRCGGKAKVKKGFGVKPRRKSEKARVVESVVNENR